MGQFEMLILQPTPAPEDVFQDQFSELLTTGKGEIETFIQFFGGSHIAERLALVNQAINAVDLVVTERGFPRILTDMNMPLNVGGYYSPSEPDSIYISPMMLLYGSIEDILQVLQHETDHYCGIYEESITDYLTLAQRTEAGFAGETVAGYHELNALLTQHLGQLSPRELLDLVVVDNDYHTLINFLEKIVVEPLLASGNEELLTAEIIEKAVQEMWPIIQKLFPRLLHSVYQTGADMHTSAEHLPITSELVRELTIRVTRRKLSQWQEVQQNKKLVEA